MSESPPLILVDTHYLCWRSFYALRFSNLQHSERPTEIMFGVFSELSRIMETFQSTKLMLFFDNQHSDRKKILPTYKEKRHEGMDQDLLLRIEGMRRQIALMQAKVLRQIGFQNVHSVDGLEADDLIAATAEYHDKKYEGQIIIATGDHDLYQCISKQVSVFDVKTGKKRSLKWFKGTYGIKPRVWRDVKALSGCKTDEVPGVRGVGDATALKFIRGELKPTSVAYKNIISSPGIRQRNLKLVSLPFPGTEPCIYEPNHITLHSWNSVMREYGMVSLVNKFTEGI